MHDARQQMIHRPFFGHGIALVAGMSFPLAFAPFGFWPLSLVSLMALIFVLDVDHRAWVILRYYLFSLGMYGVGTSWIFVSINTYGGASPVLAGALVVLFVALYSLTGLFAAALHLIIRNKFRILVFPAVWVLLEWFRGWFLTGFPWLFVGYSHLDSPLAGFAPVMGVSGVSFLCVLSAVMLYSGLTAPRLLLKPLLIRWVSFGVVIFIWVTGFLLTRVAWVSPAGQDISVSVVQGNIDQHTKWQKAMAQPILNTYLTLTREEWGRDLIVWPEASITMHKTRAESLFNTLEQHGRSSGSSLVLGVPDRDTEGNFLNTAVALGAGSGSYTKRRLVPFGEYVPMEDLLRGLISFFDLPMSRNQPGTWVQEGLLAGPLTLSMSICYEVVYPELVRQTVARPDLLVTISNDTWFGRSIGPWQHLQMARMRALENGRAMVRATNNGVTALIDHKGEIKAQLPQFSPGVLRGEVSIMEGVTPWHRYGQWPLLACCFLMVCVGMFWKPDIRTGSGGSFR